MTVPIPARKPEIMDGSLLDDALDLFKSPFGSGFLNGGGGYTNNPVTTATAGNNYGTFTLGGDFSVGGKTASAGQGEPLLNGTALIVLALVGGAIYLMGRK